MTRTRTARTPKDHIAVAVTTDMKVPDTPDNAQVKSLCFHKYKFQDINECQDPRLNKCDPQTTICINLIPGSECRCKAGYERTAESTSPFACTGFLVDANSFGSKISTNALTQRIQSASGTNAITCRAITLANAMLATKSRTPGIPAPVGRDILLKSMHSDIDECKTNPCTAHALCTNTEGSFSCVCEEGYTGLTVDFGQISFRRSEGEV